MALIDDVYVKTVIVNIITLKFQIEHTARKKLTRLKKSTNHLARDTKIGHDIEAIDI